MTCVTRQCVISFSLKFFNCHIICNVFVGHMSVFGDVCCGFQSRSVAALLSLAAGGPRLIYIDYIPRHSFLVPHSSTSWWSAWQSIHFFNEQRHQTSNCIVHCVLYILCVLCMLCVLCILCIGYCVYHVLCIV